MNQERSLALSELLFEVVNLKKEFPLERSFVKRLLGTVRTTIAVNDATFNILQGEVVGLVGESGSGKSTLAHLIIRLIEPTSGVLRYRKKEIAHLPNIDLRPFRKEAQMVFQDTHSSLNPRKTVGRTLEEALCLHGIIRVKRRGRAVELLDMVGLGGSVLMRYPHELSGGQRQRVAIARALAREPKFLVADEPVASLDVSLQAQIINLLMRLREELGLTMFFISHDLALVNHISNRVLVMYAGRIVEAGLPKEVLRTPAHPYTQSLIEAIPTGLEGRRRIRQPIIGTPPDPANIPKGCPFVLRCPRRKSICVANYPDSVILSLTHHAHCYLLIKGL